MAQIHFFRSSPFPLIEFYTVMVDGKRVGRIGRNRPLDVSVTHGKHVVSASMLWGLYKSPSLPVEVQEGETVKVGVTTWHYYDNPLLFALRFIFFFSLTIFSARFRNTYISIATIPNNS